MLCQHDTYPTITKNACNKCWVDSYEAWQNMHNGELISTPLRMKLFLVGSLSNRILQAVVWSFGVAIVCHNILKIPSLVPESWLVKQA